MSEAVDKQALTNVLVARTNMSETEARQTVDRWETQVRQTRQAIGATAQEAQETAAHYTERGAESLASAAL